MRVTMLSQLFPAPDAPLRGPNVAEQARAILNAGTCVDVASGVFQREEESAVVGGVPVRYLPVPRVRWLPSSVVALVGSLFYARRTLAYVRSHPVPPEVIHAYNAFPDGVVGCRIARALGVPCVVTLDGDDADRLLRAPVIGPLLARTLSRAAALVCTSEHMREEVGARHAALRELLVAIPNGYDPRDIGFEPHVLPSAHFLFVGALSSAKRPDLLLRAYALVAARTRLDLAFAGEGPCESDLKRLACELGIAERVRFLGRLSHREVGEMLRRAKALVLPGGHEGTPVAAIEALASGTPVIAPPTGGVPEVVNDEVTGLLVKAGDVDALATAMASASRREWDEFEVAHEAPILTWDENALRVRDVYEQVLAGNPPGPSHRLAYLSVRPTTEGQAAHAHVHGIVGGLRARGWKVDLYEPHHTADKPGPLRRLLEFVRVHRRLWEGLEGSDALYCRTHLFSLPAVVAARKLGIPVVHEVNGTWEDLVPSWLGQSRLAGVLNRLFLAQWRQAAALVTVTSPLARWIGGQAPGVPVRVIPNAVDARIFRPHGERGNALPGSYVVFVGTLGPSRGLDTLLAATTEKDWPAGVRLVIAGDGVEREAVERAVAEGRRVTYLGCVPHRSLPKILRGALAAVDPRSAAVGRPEVGWSPTGVYEALACDVPVIVTDHPGQGDLVRETGCGLVVPPGDPGALALAVHRLANDEAAARRMGTLGGKIVRHWHTWDARAGQTEDLLQRVRWQTPQQQWSAEIRGSREGAGGFAGSSSGPRF